MTHSLFITVVLLTAVVVLPIHGAAQPDQVAELRAAYLGLQEELPDGKHVWAADERHHNFPNRNRSVATTTDTPEDSAVAEWLGIPIRRLEEIRCAPACGFEDDVVATISLVLTRRSDSSAIVEAVTRKLVDAERGITQWVLYDVHLRKDESGSWVTDRVVLIAHS